MKNCTQLTFHAFSQENNVYTFSYLIDEKEYSVTLSHSAQSALNNLSKQTVLFQLGMCYLIDIAEIVVPKNVSINFNLSELQLSFWETVYKEVSKEKMMVHQLDLRLLESTWSCNPKGSSFSPFEIDHQGSQTALCLTGGKESLTLLKLLKDKTDLLLFFLNPEPNIHRQKVFDRVKDEFSTVKTISNRVKVFKKIKAEYESDIASGVDMAHLVFNTLLFGTLCKYVLIGNEYSSNFPNQVYQGYVINHQYVKTIYFAEKLNRYLHTFVTKDFSYYSPFFGLYELNIAKQLFSSSQYLEVWTSCNQTTATLNFCSNCHKCAFTYLIASVYCDPEFLSTFFSRDMLQDLNLFKPLMDFTGEKPLDCVGEKIEVWVALAQLLKKDAYKETPVVQYFQETLLPFIRDEMPAFEIEVNSIQKVPQQLPVELEKIIAEAYENTAILSQKDNREL